MHDPAPDKAGTRASWEWLADVGPRLGVAIELLDDRHEPLTPPGPTADAAALRALLTSGDPSLCAAVSTATQPGTRVPVAVEKLHALCIGLAPAGALLLARRLASHESAGECLDDLEAIGTWLAGPVESSLADPSAVNAEPYRIMSFRRILREAATRGSVRMLMGAFVEALSVWDDVCVHTYAEAADGGFLRYASSIAAAPSSPERIEGPALPRAARPVALSRAEVDRLGLSAGPGETVIHRIRSGRQAGWLLVFSGTIDQRAQVRTRVYSDMLRESLNEMLATAASRVAAEVSRRDPPRRDEVHTAVESALVQVADAAGGSHAALVVTTPAGRQALTVGDADRLLDSEDGPAHRLVVTTSDSDGITMVAIGREHAPFTAFEREIVEAAAAAMHVWVQLPFRHENHVERRRRSQPIDVLFDRLAEAAVAAGRSASVVVMSLEDATQRPGLLAAWLGTIRALIRGGDRAGILSDREIAVLLDGASEREAAAVTARLANALESAESTEPFPSPTIGMTTRVPYAPIEGSLVEAARASAAAAP